MERLVVVSNRVPSISGDASAGGLAVGLEAAIKSTGGLWFGWSGQIAEGSVGAKLSRSDPFALVTMDLSKAEHAGYYDGFANRTLWPCLHGRSDLTTFDPSTFAIYSSVNQRFARELLPHLGADDLIWVHDYHLLLAGRELRRCGVDAPIGFFLHVPFPPADVLSTLPRHRELVDALVAYDLVGFQTENDLHNFHDYMLRHLRGRIGREGSVCVFGHRFRTGVFPIGIDAERFTALGQSKEARRLRSHMRGCFARCRGVIGVDRLDYTKGLVQRILAFERLLDTSPKQRGRTFLLQIAAPSREAVPEYTALKQEIAALTERVNARYRETDWVPIRYFNKAFSQDRVATLYNLSRVGFVTPLRDGMNLVAKEYVAAQDPSDPGVLILSRFAGAAERLDGALMVNPYDIDEMAHALKLALMMPHDERSARWTSLMGDITTNDVYAWRERFVAALRSSRPPSPLRPEKGSARVAIGAIGGTVSNSVRGQFPALDHGAPAPLAEARQWTR